MTEPRPLSEPRPDDHWLAGSWGWCRALVKTGWKLGKGYGRRGCRQPTVASVLRGRSRPSRWGYCEVHLADYGRVVRDGQVWWDPDGAKALVIVNEGVFQ